MDIRTHANMLLQSLATVLRIPDADCSKVVFDERNECFLTFDEHIVLMFYLDEDIRSIIINIILGALPANDSREELMYEFLTANYCWNLTEGGTLGVDRDTAVITLGYLVELPLAPPEQFESIIEKLLNVSDFWMKKIAQTVSAERNSNVSEFSAPHMIRA